MQSLFSYVAPPSECGYLPDQTWSLQYEYVDGMTPGEYLAYMKAGWRHFGSMLFRPRCPSCCACQSLRVKVRAFRPDRSQRRCWRQNGGEVKLQIGLPSVSDEKLDLYDRYHEFQTEHRGWPLHPAKDPESYADSFVRNPFPIHEYCYYLGRRLIGVGYVDSLPGALSAIYFYYDPEERHRSLGTFNVLCQLDVAARRPGVDFLYLGYYVPGCRSMEYKPRFRPNQIRHGDGEWRDFL